MLGRTFGDEGCREAHHLEELARRTQSGKTCDVVCEARNITDGVYEVVNKGGGRPRVCLGFTSPRLAASWVGSLAAIAWGGRARDDMTITLPLRY